MAMTMPKLDVEHNRRRDHAIRVPVRQVEEARQVENVAESIEYAAENRGHLEVGGCAGAGAHPRVSDDSMGLEAQALC
jgi:hypothetical protein